MSYGRGIASNSTVLTDGPPHLNEVSPIRRVLTVLEGIGIDVFSLENTTLSLVSAGVLASHPDTHGEDGNDADTVAASGGDQGRPVRWGIFNSEGGSGDDASQITQAD